MSPNGNLWMSCPNLSFTIEIKMGNLHKAGRISNFSSNFKNLSMNCDMFSIGKNESLNPLKILHSKTFGLRKGPANSLTPLSPNVQNANINSKT